MGFLAGRAPITSPMPKKGAAESEAPGAATNTEDTVPVQPSINLPRGARTIGSEGMEATLREVEETRLANGRTVPDLVTTDVSMAREALMEGLKTADHHGATDVHQQVGAVVLAVDDLLSWLGARSGS